MPIITVPLQIYYQSNVFEDHAKGSGDIHVYQGPIQKMTPTPVAQSNFVPPQQ